MRVTFKGSPATVLRDMKEFIAGLETKVEFTPDVLAEAHRRVGNVLQAMDKPGGSEPTEVKLPEGVEIDTAKIKEMQSGERGRQTEGESVCRYCEKYTGRAGWVGRHEKHCRSNPNRVPHPKEGQMNPGLRKFVNDRRKSHPSGSRSSEPTGPSETTETMSDTSGRSTPSTFSGDIGLPESMPD